MFTDLIDKLAYMSLLSDRIKLALTEAGLDQSELARLVGVSSVAVNGWCTGSTKTIKGDNLLKAAAALRVTPEWLSSGKGSMRCAEPSAHYSIEKAHEPADIGDFLDLLSEKLDGADETTRATIGDMLRNYIIKQSPDPRIAEAIKAFLK